MKCNQFNDKTPLALTTRKSILKRRSHGVPRDLKENKILLLYLRQNFPDFTATNLTKPIF